MTAGPPAGLAAEPPPGSPFRLDAGPARPRRFPWLLLPAAALAVFLAACAGGWVYAGARLGGEIDARAQALRRAGWTVDLEGRRFAGFPFRLKFVHARVRLVAPSGWGVEAPGAEAEALIFDPAHWVFAAPRGLVLERGAAGPLQVSGRALSASVAGIGGRPWRVALVGEGLMLRAAPGARAPTFATAARMEAYLKPVGADGDGEVLVQITEATPSPRGLVYRLSGGAPVTAVVEGRLARLAAYAGPDAASRSRAWAAAGGAYRVNRVEARGGATRLSAAGGSLTVGPDGRLAGDVPLRLVQTPSEVAGAVDPAGEAADAAARQSERADTRLVFGGGVVRLGGVRVGPSPKVG